MLKFSNEDYSIPRERMGFHRGISCPSAASVNDNRFRCDGTRSTAPGLSCGVSLPDTCGGKASLASVYSPYQEYIELFDSMSALCNGTLFKELFKPLAVGGCNG